MGHSRIVLVARKEAPWLSTTKQALLEIGVEIVETHNCWSAEFAQQRDPSAGFLVDARIVCDFVSPERPGAILGLASKLPVLIFHAEELDAQHRSAATAHHAALLDGDDIPGITRLLDELLSGDPESG